MEGVFDGPFCVSFSLTDEVKPNPILERAIPTSKSTNLEAEYTIYYLRNNVSSFPDKRYVVTWYHNNASHDIIRQSKSYHIISSLCTGKSSQNKKCGGTINWTCKTGSNSMGTSSQFWKNNRDVQNGSSASKTANKYFVWGRCRAQQKGKRCH